MTVDQFETLVQVQQPAEVPWQPVTDYSFAARKAIEGRHPELILETFKPKRVLDVGCGPGHLVVLLNDLAGHSIAYGADKHGDPEFVVDIAQSYPIRLRPAFDLVICREVLEHLTIREVRQAVTNLCKLTERFVYLTTRFHLAPQSLLDVATSDDLDPTHITMLNKDFLRLLFVLEGFKRRADLEERMDWQGKGRVLVYERA
jgi:SAM-dependent methyltransferase